jgi:DMSO/TMAO reductase YedYZ heme-binding membrane subunit
VRARNRHTASLTAGTGRCRWGRRALATALLAAGCGALAGAGKDSAILAAVERFLLFYSGVFALIALTATVAAGLVATDRIVMPAAGRLLSQNAHRALSLAAVGLLAAHVLMEVLAHRSRPVDTVVPFTASGRALYVGLGTLASDLLLLVLVTGVARGRFAAWPASWRAVHVTAYLAWPLAILHGLLAGRPARPYVAWSYGGCLAAVALALGIRLVATARSSTKVISRPVASPPVLSHEARVTAPVTDRPPISLAIRPVPRHAALPGGGQDSTEPP